MSAVLEKKYYSVEEYLALEDEAEFKSEYYDGEMYPMAGGTINHNQISINVCMILALAFRKRDFRVFSGDVKLKIPNASFTYPDVLVIQGEPEYWNHRKDIISSANLIIEILSDSTQDYDKGGKFQLYRRLPELQDYILIDQEKVQVEHFEKQAPHQWLLNEYQSLEDEIQIKQFNESIKLLDIYEKVDFEPASE